MPRKGWHVLGKSVRGASHVRNNLPNQDAILWNENHELGLPIIMAVSDGHGSAKCFRSDKGSRIAVKIATETLNDFFTQQSDIQNLTMFKRLAEERLTKEIIKRWDNEVLSDIEQQPYSEEDIECLKGGKATLAYGATLLAVLITDKFIIYLQLGDGDILIISNSNEIERPIPKDDRLIANETTSLCQDNAWQDFQIHFQPVIKKPPRLIILATDGYANSFSNDENFLKVAPDLLQVIEAEGFDSVDQNMELWLKDASEHGSGDDITVGLITSFRQRRKNRKFSIAEETTYIDCITKQQEVEAV
jgi:serine/threonine protein phosphatase PrpC